MRANVPVLLTASGGMEMFPTSGGVINISCRVSLERGGTFLHSGSLAATLNSASPGAGVEVPYGIAFVDVVAAGTCTWKLTGLVSVSSGGATCGFKRRTIQALELKR